VTQSASHNRLLARSSTVGGGQGGGGRRTHVFDETEMHHDVHSVSVTQSHLCQFVLVSEIETGKVECILSQIAPTLLGRSHLILRGDTRVACNASSSRARVTRARPLRVPSPRTRNSFFGADLRIKPDVDSIPLWTSFYLGTCNLTRP
jgi:hypothetical protein